MKLFYFVVVFKIQKLYAFNFFIGLCIMLIIQFKFLSEMNTFVLRRIDSWLSLLRVRQLASRAAWLLLFVFSASCCLYVTIRSISDYLAFKVSTTVRVHTAATQAFLFPRVTICNLNSLNSEYAVTMYRLAGVANVSLLTTNTYDVMQALESYQKRTTGAYFTADEKRRLFDLDAMLISCSYQQKPCHIDDFEYFFDSYNLNCIRFNSPASNGKELRRVNGNGGGGELSVELYVGLRDELASARIKRGVHVWLDNPLSKPLKLSTSWITVTPGLASVVRSRRVRYKLFNKWPFAYSDCTVDADSRLLAPLSDSSLFDQMRAANFTYSHENCLAVCYQRNLVNECNCVDYWVNWLVAGYDYCSEGAKIACSYAFYTKRFLSGDFMATHCQRQCPNECVRERYVNSLSYASYPSDKHLERDLKNNPMLVSKLANQTDFRERLASNVVKLSVVFETEWSEAVEDPRLDWDGLMAQIGGHVHLFLGMSLMSFVELLEFGILLFENKN